MKLKMYVFTIFLLGISSVSSQTPLISFPPNTGVCAWPDIPEEGETGICTPSLLSEIHYIPNDYDYFTGWYSIYRVELGYDFSTEDGTAKAGKDYIAKQGKNLVRSNPSQFNTLLISEQFKTFQINRGVFNQFSDTGR